MFHRRMNARPSLVILSAAVLALLAIGTAACGGSGTSNGGSYKHADGGKEVVLRVNSGGGFVTVQYNLRSVPQFTLYGDGTIIVTGPTTTIYPGAALPNLQTTKVSEDTIQAMLSAAQEAGLFANEVDYGRPGITDMDTTTITVNVDGKTYESNLYALSTDAAGGDLTMEQQQARAEIATLVGRLNGVESFQQGLQWASYQFTSLTAFSTPAVTGGGGDVQPNKLDWPLGDLGTLGEATQPEGFRKAVVTGADLEKLRPLFDQTTEITIWNSGGKEYNVIFRPLLPDETV
jgi:hypothetical protein